MKKRIGSVSLAALFLTSIAAQAQRSNSTLVEPLRVVERGPHHALWQSVSLTEVDGQTFSVTNAYTELQTGMNAWSEAAAAWIEASDEIELSNGYGIARKTQHHVVFSPDLKDPAGSVDFFLPDGRRMRGRVTGLVYTETDTGKSVWVGEVKGSIGQIVGRNEVLYSDAFDAVKADVRYTHTLNSFEQDVILRERLPLPEEYGLKSQTTRLEVWTEFFDPPQPSKNSRPIHRLESGSDTDELLDFGGMQIVLGRAFALGGPRNVDHVNGIGGALPISKTWTVIDRRTFLIESIPYQDIKPHLDELPVGPQALRLDRKKRDQVAALAPATVRGLPTQVALFEPTTQSPRRPEILLARNGKPTPDRPGVVLDYVIVLTTTNALFQGDSTYFVSGTVNLSGTENVFEGGAIVKYAASPASQIRVLGSVKFKSAPYRPVFFTAKDDNSIGETISGSSGNPTASYYADPALSFDNPVITDLKNVRFLHARTGIYYSMASGTNHTVTHAQFVRCENAIAPHTAFKLRNALMANVLTNFAGNAAYAFQGYCEHLSIDTSSVLSAGSTSSYLSIVNSLLVAVTTIGSATPDYTASFWLSDSSTVFRAEGGGGHYLKESSPYRNVGTTSIDPSLAEDLKTRTTYAPLTLANPLVVNPTLSPQAQRDADTPDVGYHYEPLDYLIPEIAITNSVLTLTNGVVVGTKDVYGFSLYGGAVVNSEGTALTPNRLVRFRTAQENPIAQSSPQCYSIRFAGASSPTPEVKAQFTEFYLLPSSSISGHIFSTFYGSMKVTLRDCQFKGGRLPLQNQDDFTYQCNNGLFERVYAIIQGKTVNHYNNLHFGGTLKFYVGTGTACTAKDNLFDKTSLFNGNAGALDFGWNGYVTNYNRLLPEGPANVTLTGSPLYQSTVLGSYYLPSGSPLINLGSRTGGSAGLYQHTTQTSAASKEGASQVDIGFHYTGLNAQNQPIDTDADGLPDYFEDRNGDGVGTNDTYNWQNSDTDGDGLGDLLEYQLSMNGVVSVARVNDPSQDSASGDPNKNSQSECSFVVVDSSRIVAAFFDTHLSAYGLGQVNFPGIVSPRSTGWAVSTNGGASFTDNGAMPPASPANTTQGDAGDPVMARDTANGTIYSLGNPSRESAAWGGFRLWKSTDNGASFSLINTSVPSVISGADKPMIAANNFAGLGTSGYLYAAGTGRLSGGPTGVFVTHSSDGGANWDGVTSFEGDTHGADIAIRPDGTAYVVYLGWTNANGILTTSLKYNWLPPGQTNWSVPTTINAHSDRAALYSTNYYASGNLKRSNSASEQDYFVSNGFPRVAVNPVNGRVYLVYADLPYAGSSTDRSDIFANEGVPNADGSLTWTGVRKVTTDLTSTDQWNPSVAVNPAGTQIFIGYYSRQVNPSQNDSIRAYGAKANLANGLTGAIFDVFPISAPAFPPLFPGTVESTPSANPWMYDHVWAQTEMCLDSNAMIISCPSPDYLPRTDATYQHFMADDYTWAGSDSSYFYYAWCDRSDSYIWQGHSRPDPNIRLGKIRQ